MRGGDGMAAVTALGALSAIVVICVLNPPHFQSRELLQERAGDEVMLHLLTSHERELFREEKEQRHALPQNMLASWKSFAREHPPKQPSTGVQTPNQPQQQMLNWPYRRSSGAAQLDPLGKVIHYSSPHEREEVKKYILNSLNSQNQGEDSSSGEDVVQYSEENPPCYTPEDCDQRARANGYWGKKENKLPIYDDDTAEFLAAMQKQDRMILDHKKDKERRQSLGSEAPKLPEVIVASSASRLARSGAAGCTSMRSAPREGAKWEHAWIVFPAVCDAIQCPEPPENAIF
eukprot:CAMPEP_0196753748 /NCGR_PEP_ID=MMETSP1091-20130531/91768_1 /TAXON_ID=302021 /ORGANISM="Rhodomonas sp., Strain CCMP768" /LENGTH=288 /DNA_ID=CAMNT_0042101903 /DNA_START=15 /DNA_END=879 /DNA_ORIENTATION=+